MARRGGDETARGGLLKRVSMDGRVRWSVHARVFVCLCMDVYAYKWR